VCKTGPQDEPLTMMPPRDCRSPFDQKNSPQSMTEPNPRACTAFTTELGVLHKLLPGWIREIPGSRRESNCPLVFRLHDPEPLPVSLLWCRHAAVTVIDVAVQFPLPLLLLPNDDVLALVEFLSLLTVDRVLRYFDGGIAMALHFDDLQL